MNTKIGYMQGRLVDRIDGRIQAFPLTTWRDEFPIAHRIGVRLVEWTLDDDQLAANPFCTGLGQAEIRTLSKVFPLGIDSVTGDCFMQTPFWKCAGREQQNLLQKLDLVIDSCVALGVNYIVIPLVDNGGLESAQQAKILNELLMLRRAKLCANDVHIAFESDYPPAQLRDFIADYPADTFGINYDIGNSASLGFDPEQEMLAYSQRITNVHVKDRILGGTSVPLGTGAAKMREVLIGLKSAQYRGNFILQTARAVDDTHEQTLARYVAWTSEQLELHFGS